VRSAIEQVNPADLLLYAAATTRFEELLAEWPVADA
jgi:hypothetical protein